MRRYVRGTDQQIARITDFVDYIYGQRDSPPDMTRSLKDNMLITQALSNVDAESWASQLPHADLRSDFTQAVDSFMWELITLNAFYMSGTIYYKLCSPFVDINSVEEDHVARLTHVLHDYFRVIPTPAPEPYCYRMYLKYYDIVGPESGDVVERMQDPNDEDEILDNLYVKQSYLSILNPMISVDYYYKNNQDMYGRKHSGRGSWVYFRNGVGLLRWSSEDLKPSIIPYNNWEGMEDYGRFSADQFNVATPFYVWPGLPE